MREESVARMSEATCGGTRGGTAPDVASLIRATAPSRDTAPRSRDTICPSFASSSPFENERAQGTPDAGRTRGSCVQRNCAFHARKQRQGSRDNRRSLRDGLRLIRPLLGVPGFLAAVASRDHLSAKLDPSVGGSGPYDFAVRACAPRLSRATASTASRLAFRDEWPNAPLAEAGRGDHTPDLHF